MKTKTRQHDAQKQTMTMMGRMEIVQDVETKEGCQCPTVFKLRPSSLSMKSRRKLHIT
jgi:hypothetical protein